VLETSLPRALTSLVARSTIRLAKGFTNRSITPSLAAVWQGTAGRPVFVFDSRARPEIADPGAFTEGGGGSEPP